MKTPLLLPLLSALLAGCTEEYEAVFGDPVAGAHRRWIAEDEQECEHGDGQACARLAERYRQGADVPKDADRAAAYLRKACDFGDRPSCNQLAQALARHAPGISRDSAEAGRLFERLCDRGDPAACYNRAVMFINGEGEQQSYEAAVPWLQKACTPKYKEGCDTLQELREKRLVRQDAGRFRSASPPERATLAASQVSYAVDLRKWFPKEIRLPVPYSPRDLPVSARNLCRTSEVQTHATGDSLIVTGRLSVGTLPAGLRAAERSGRAGRYRLLAVGYVVSPDGGALWAGEVIGSEAVWADERGTGSSSFSVMIDKPRPRGAALLIVVGGDPISVGPQDEGGAVVLGTSLHPL